MEGSWFLHLDTNMERKGRELEEETPHIKQNKSFQHWKALEENSPISPPLPFLSLCSPPLFLFPPFPSKHSMNVRYFMYYLTFISGVVKWAL